MSFETTLRDVFASCPDVAGAALMGSDGIPIAQWEARDALGQALAPDLTTLAVEFGRILDEARKTADSLSGGAPEELTLRLARYWLLLRVIDEDIQLVVVLAPDGNVGRARFGMRRSVAVLREQL